VRVFRLDRERVLERIRRGAERLVREQPSVAQVWLFGSMARGDASPGSDADLLIIVNGESGRFLERPGPFVRYFHDVGVGCDLIVYTQREAERLVRHSGSLAATAMRDGMLLASAPHETRGSAPTSRRQR
jgi:predicted nucleotidyltransferase